MNEFLEVSVYWGLLLTLVTYGFGAVLKKKLKLAIFNPILISAALCIAFLLIFRVDYDVYSAGAHYLSYLLTPATICLAIPLHRQVNLLKKNKTAILLGVGSGVLTSLVTILLLVFLLGMDHREYVSLLPKSITTAIGIGVCQELGGYVSITVAAILLTGILGNALAETVFKIFRIREPIARGIAIGTASHAVGTAKALELGEVEGAMSSLSIVVSGILTVFGASVFAGFL